jgi:hypothetical protein
MPELIDLTEEERHADCEALSQLLRVVPVTIEPTLGEAHAVRVFDKPYAA